MQSDLETPWFNPCLKDHLWSIISIDDEEFEEDESVELVSLAATTLFDATQGLKKAVEHPWEKLLTCILYLVLILSLGGIVFAMVTMKKEKAKDTILIDDDSEKYGAEYALLQNWMRRL